jgi:hypothetical protein
MTPRAQHLTHYAVKHTVSGKANSERLVMKRLRSLEEAQAWMQVYLHEHPNRPISIWRVEEIEISQHP